MEKKNYHEPAFEIYDVSSSKILSGKMFFGLKKRFFTTFLICTIFLIIFIVEYKRRIFFI